MAIPVARTQPVTPTKKSQLPSSSKSRQYEQNKGGRKGRVAVEQSELLLKESTIPESLSALEKSVERGRGKKTRIVSSKELKKRNVADSLRDREEARKVYDNSTGESAIFKIRSILSERVPRK